MNYKILLIAATVLVSCLATSFAAEEEILIADFEGGDYGEWTVEGDAFGTAPANGTHPSLKRVYGYEGKSLISSLTNGNDAKGKLISPEFTVDRDYMVFSIGGGESRNTSLRLLIDGKEVIRHAGFNTSEMIWRSWTLTKWRGKKARLEIVDDEKDEWGHIHVDYYYSAT